ncbi:MAG: FprA family A-type flavoprotein [Euryarchaeota archaeon]|nr:FprA family A-type flavoprotein [Euryarchaeota archaeon]
MAQYDVQEISKGVHWVGVRDWDRRMFDELIPLPQGTTYNAYLVRGEKTALIDTVNPGFENELLAKITMVMNPAEIDYIVMNHAEPDHAGSIPFMLEQCPRAKLITTKKGARMAELYFGATADRTIVVKDGDVIDLGGRILRFAEAPWLHWPETMFTFLEGERVLFSCDFFGAHTAKGLWDDENEELYSHAQSYFGEIMMPFRKFGRRGVEKARELDPLIIAPSHGPMHRHPENILGLYHRWTSGETRNKAIIAYVSMWSATRALVRTMSERLAAEGVEVVQYDLPCSDIGEIAKDLVDARAIILGSPAFLGGMHPQAVYAATLVKALRPPAKFAAVLSSFGWGGGAVKQAGEILGPTGMEIVGTVEMGGPPTEAEHSAVAQLAKDLAARMSE